MICLKWTQYNTDFIKAKIKRKCLYLGIYIIIAIVGLFSEIYGVYRPKQKNYPRIYMSGMNNAIIATIFVAMMMGGGLVTGFVFNMPQDSLIYEKATGDSPLDGNSIIKVGGQRR
jgi:cell division protein FtsW (lipid II flippase)